MTILKTKCFKLNSELLNELKKTATELDITQSDLLANILEDGLNKYKTHTVQEAFKDLVDIMETKNKKEKN